MLFIWYVYEAPLGLQLCCFVFYDQISKIFPKHRREEKKAFAWRFIWLEKAFCSLRGCPVSKCWVHQTDSHRRFLDQCKRVSVFPKLIISLLWGDFAPPLFFSPLKMAVIITSMNEHDHHHLFPVFEGAPVPLHNHYLVYDFCQWQ